jgi:aspartyl-tRNA(Asn)/glutamyl-tRNA(Gln) amidotransferase subunit A
MYEDMTEGLDRRGFLAGAAAVTVGGALVGARPASASETALRALKHPQRDHRTHPADLDISEAVSLLRTRRLSSRELVAACLERIEERDGDLTAWERVYADEALVAAAVADRSLGGRGAPAPLLCGIPIGFKDIIAVGGKPLTAGSRALEGNVAPSDSHAWERARAEGMVLLGHTKSQEFASGNNTQTAGNPYDPRKSPGGSSNGSGAAVGGRMIPVGLGTDSGGSLRRPASACGLNSLMATYGLVSTRGIVTGARGNDHVGALVRSAVDVSLMLTLMAGRDPLDPTTYAAPRLPSLPLEPRGGAKPFRGMRFGLTPAIPATDTLDPGVRAVFERFIDDLRGMGAEFIELTLPPQPAGAPGPSPEAVLLHRDLWPAKGHLYTRGSRESVASQQANASARTALADYEAQVRRGQWVAELQQIFGESRIDALVQCCQQLETPLRGPGGPEETGDLLRFGSGTVRGMWNTANFPALSLPGGLSPVTGMPAGIQLVGAPWSDAKLLQIAIDYQARSDHHRTEPGMWDE